MMPFQTFFIVCETLDKDYSFTFSATTYSS